MRVRKWIVIMVVLVITVRTVYAEPAVDVLVVYEERTETNRHAIKFLSDYFRANGTEYKVNTLLVDNTGDFVPSEYLAVVILNTGRQSGISPSLTTFIDRWASALPVVTVNLRAQRESTAVETSGVDAVTAATRWKSRGLFGRTNDVYEMHEKWAEFVLSAINSRVQGG
jgi:hypothetical protein